MRILITGAGAGLGAALARTLIARGTLRGDAITCMGLAHPLGITAPRAGFEIKTYTVESARRDPLDEAVADGWHVIFHCEMGTARRAEADFVAGMRTTFFAGLNVMESARAVATKPMIVFASSTCAQGDTPLVSNGAQCRIVETLAADYGRRGFIEARAVRFADIVSARRPGAAFEVCDLVSSPLQAASVAVPLKPKDTLHLISGESAAIALIDAAERAAGPSLEIDTAPATATTVGDMIAALGAEERELIEFDHDGAPPPLSPAPQTSADSETPGEIVAAVARALSAD